VRHDNDSRLKIINSTWSAREKRTMSGCKSKCSRTCTCLISATENKLQQQINSLTSLINGIISTTPTTTFRGLRLAAFNASTLPQTFIVPANTPSIIIKTWGGGGAGSAFDGQNNPGSGGGAGGYIERSLPVTTGTTLTINVGFGGLQSLNTSTDG